MSAAQPDPVASPLAPPAGSAAAHSVPPADGLSLPPPELSDADLALLGDLADPYRTLSDIFRNHSIDCDQLLHWLRSPHIQTVLDRMCGISAFRARLIAAERQPEMIAALINIAQTPSDHPEASRKAAVNALRFAGGRRGRLRAEDIFALDHAMEGDDAVPEASARPRRSVSLAVERTTRHTARFAADHFPDVSFPAPDTPRP